MHRTAQVGQLFKTSKAIDFPVAARHSAINLKGPSFMQTNSRIFDDIARLASGALGTAQGMKSEWENLVHQRIERLVADMDLVPREEFDAMKAMLVAMSDTLEVQNARIAELEKKVAAAKKAPAAKKASAAKKEKTPASKTAE